MKKLILKVWMILAISFLAMDVVGQAPTVVSLSPVNGADGVAVDAQINIEFNMAIRARTGVNNSELSFIRIHYENGGVYQEYWSNGGSFCERTLTGYDEDGNPEYSFTVLSSNIISIVNNNTLRINVSGDTSPNYLNGLTYYVTIGGFAIYSVDSSMRFAGFVNNSTWRFTTENLPLPPVPTVYTPSQGAVSAPIDQSLSLEFDKAIQLGTGSLQIWEEGGLTPWAIYNQTDFGTNLTIVSSSTLNITLPMNLDEGSHYYVLMDPGFVESLEGVGFEGIISNVGWGFTTKFLPPSVVNYTPEPGLQDVPLNAIFTLTFNEEITFGEENALFLIHRDGSVRPLLYNSEEVSISSDNLQLVINLSNTPLTRHSTQYYILIQPGFVRSVLTGVDFEGILEVEDSPISDQVWHFTTESAQPRWVDPYPNISNQTQTGFTFNALADITGVYYGVVTLSPTAPAVEQIKAGLDNSGISEAKIKFNQEVNSITSPSSLNVNFNTQTPEGDNYFLHVVFSNLTGTRNSEVRTLGIDRKVPTLQITNPDNGRLTFPVDSLLTVSFNEQVAESDGNPLTGEYFSLVKVGDPLLVVLLDIVVETISETTIIKLSPTVPLDPNSSYTLTISPVYDLSGNASIERVVNFETDGVSTWTGGGNSSDWTDAANWGGSNYVQYKSVLIPAESSPYPSITTGVIDVHNLTIEPGALLTHTGGTLNITGLFTLESSTISNASYVPGGVLGISGDRVRVEQVIPNPSVSYMISSPTNNSTISNIRTTGPLYYFSNATDTWELHGAGPMNSGSGYLTWTSQSPLVFSGFINDSDVSVSVSYTPGQGSGWNLVGNPYTAGLDWSKIVLPATIENNIWIWQPNEKVYGSLSGESSVFINLGSPIIPSNHAFLVRTVQPIGGGTLQTSFDFTTSAIVADIQNDTYLKAASVSSFEFFKIAGIKNNLKDETAVVFADDASEGKDKYDVQKYFSSSPDVLELFTLSNSARTGINAMPFEDYKEIALGYRASNPGPYSIGLVKNVTSGKKVILIDKLNGTEVDLEEVDEYRFSIASSGINTTRFALRFTSLVPGVVTSDKLNGPTDSINMKVYTNGKQIFIDVNGDSTNYQFRLYDISGRLIKTGEFYGGRPVTIGSFNVGAYICEVFHPNGLAVNKQKVVVY